VSASLVPRAQAPRGETVRVRVIVGREQRRSQEFSGAVLSPVVPDQHFHGHFLRRGRRRQKIRGHLTPLGLVASVLEPDLDLRLGELEGGREVRALRPGEIALVIEAPLELEHLRVRKRGARTLLPLLGLIDALLLRRVTVWRTTITHDFSQDGRDKL